MLTAAAVNPSRSESVVQSGGLDQNHFVLLGLPVGFQVDLHQLDQARQRIQAVVHPDRFAAAGPAQKRIALQWSTRIHEAYETLREPLRRAAYLLSLQGLSIEAESNTRMPAAFLEQQMEWREALEAAREQSCPEREASLEALRLACGQAREAGLQRLSRHLEQTDGASLQAASAEVRALLFIEKFSEELR